MNNDPSNGNEAAPEQEKRGDSGHQESSGGQKGQSGKGESGGGGKGKQSSKPSTPEWVVGIVCSIVLLAALGYLFYEAFSRPSLPPLITMQVERVVPMERGYLVEFRAVNDGTHTAMNVHIEGTLMRDTIVAEKSGTTLDFVPSGTERSGGLYFTKNPRQYRLEVRPTGYDRP